MQIAISIELQIRKCQVIAVAMHVYISTPIIIDEQVKTNTAEQR